MGLSWQQGPLSSGTVGHFLVPDPLPERLLFAEPLRRRMRGLLHPPGRNRRPRPPAGAARPVPGAPGARERAGTGTGLLAIPCTDTYRISVKREPCGLVSGYMNDSVRPGNVIDAAAPRGKFMLSPLPESE
jgi:hypothetical protein